MALRHGWVAALGAVMVLGVGVAEAVGPRATHPRGPFAEGQLIDGECPSRYPRCLSFTFDDGPDPRTTPRLLELLEQRRMRATFFVVGHRLDGDDAFHQANRAVLAETARRGHAIGHHGYRHVVLDGLGPGRLAYEFDRTDALIARAIGHRPAFFRAPFGELATTRAVEAVGARGMTPVYWALDTRDWAVHTPREVLRNFRAALDAHPRGGVVLMHDTRRWSVESVPLIFAELDRRNAALGARGEAPYRVVGLGAFVRRRGVAPLQGMPAGAMRHRHPRSATTP